MLFNPEYFDFLWEMVFLPDIGSFLYPVEEDPRLWLGLDNFEWYYIFPEISLSIILIINLVIISQIYYSSKNKLTQLNALEYRSRFSFHLLNSLKSFMLALMGMYFWMIMWDVNVSMSMFNYYFHFDLFSTLMKMLVILTAMFVVSNSLEHRVSQILEYSTMLISSTLFLVILMSANDLLLIFISMMGFSLNMYVLLMLPTDHLMNLFSFEAAMKYFYLSALSSGLMAMGVALIYLLFNTTNLSSIEWHTFGFLETDIDYNKGLLILAMYSIMYGFLFKLAAFPGHLWAPEIYNGSSSPMMIFFMLPMKIAVFTALIKLLIVTFSEVYSIWSYVMWFSSLGSMIWGCLGAFTETKLRKFIAYSSINQMGFLLMGLVSVTSWGLKSTIMYLIMYIMMNVGFLQMFNNNISTTYKLVLVDSNWVEFKSNELKYMTYLADFRYQYSFNKFETLSLMIILFSMSGMPPLGGFFGKYFLFMSAFESEYYSLVIIGMLTSVMSTFYYLKMIKIVMFEVPESISMQKNYPLNNTMLSVNQTFGQYCLIQLMLGLLVTWIMFNTYIMSFVDLIAMAC